MNNQEEINKLNKIINNSKKELLNNNDKKIALTLGSILMILEEIALYAFLQPIIPVKTTIAVMALFYIASKLSITLVFGTRIGKKKKNIKLNNIINESETKKEILEKEERKKEIIKQKENTNTEVLTNTTKNNHIYRIKSPKSRVLSINKNK